MIIGLQIIALLFAFSMIYFAVLNFKRGELSSTEVGSWVVMWLGTIVIVVFPELLQDFARTFSVARVFDLMVIGGFVVVITLVGSAYIRTKKIEKKLGDLVRRDALKSRHK